MANNTIEQYLSADLFAELGMENISPEERMIFIEKISDVVQQRLLLRLMKEMTEDQKGRLETMLADPNKDFSSVAQFLALEIPNFQQITEEEVANYKKELIGRYKA